MRSLSLFDLALLRSAEAIPDPSFVLDASAITGLLDLDPVTTWEDTTVNNRDFSQATAANKPTYRTAQQNGLPGVLFATNDYMTSALVASGSTEFTVFIVSKFTSAGVTEVPFHYGGISNAFLYIENVGNRTVQERAAAVTVNCADAAGVTTPELLTIMRESTAPLTSMWVGGVSQALTNSGAAMGAIAAEAALGAFVNGGVPSLFFNGTLFEIRVYLTDLTTAVRQAIEAELMTKWAV